MTDLQLGGLHHLTAITADAPGNRRFYTDALGMRLVKKTVNQDDTSAYHLFYADGRATPGTDVTFFDWPAPPERRGTHAIARTGLRVAGEASLDWWRERLAEPASTVGEIAEPTAARRSTSRIPRASASAWSTTAAPARRIRGRGARCRPSTRSAGSARSRSQRAAAGADRGGADRRA